MDTLSTEQKTLIDKILKKTIEFVDNELFDSVEVEKELFKDDISLPDIQWYLTYLSSMDRVPINVAILTNKTNQSLTQEQEKIMFLRFNYAKKVLTQLIEQAKQFIDEIDNKLAEALVYWHECAIFNRNCIASVNVALVIKLSRKVKGCYDSDFIALGNLSLLYAIRKFDISKGFKFSTYLWYAVYHDMIKENMKQTLHNSVFPCSQEDDEDSVRDVLDIYQEEEDYDNIDLIRYILDNKIAKLTHRESNIIQLRFFAETEEKKRFTLGQIAQRLGASYSCIQKSEKVALKKIKRAWTVCCK